MHRINNKNQNKRMINVGVRMRPLLHLFQDDEVWEINSAAKTISSLHSSTVFQNITDNAVNTLQPKQRKKAGSIGLQKSHRYQFTYDYVFGPSHSNREVYTTSCQSIINQFCINGRNGTIFMYGQTTSGKTYTMLGDQHTSGIIEFSLKDIFKQFNQGIFITYLEIYNEQINDLLNPGAINLKIIDDRVHGAMEVEVNCYEDAIELLEEGEKQRSYSEKKYHDHSSRSHTLFQIQIKKGNNKIKATLNLVDLAGSERLADEDSNQETGYINKSLFVLSNVIQRLASSKKNLHVPYRDSKLTRLLYSSLGGESSTAIICTISPALVNFHQTLSSLRFAACSRKVQLKPYSQVSQQNILKSQQSKQILQLREQNLRLKQSLSFSSISKQSEQNFLQQKVKQISAILHQSKPQLSGWEDKLSMLCKQYRKNIETLQKQYTKALVNAISVQCEINKQNLMWALEQFKDKI